MQPVPLDNLYLNATGALWAGQREGLAQGTEKINQQKSLEDIAKSQQDRDFAKQKLPGELETQGLQREVYRGTLENQKLEREKTGVEIDDKRRNANIASAGQLIQMIPMEVGESQGIEAQQRIAAAAQRLGIPSDSNFLKTILAVHGQKGNAGVAELGKQIYENSQEGVKSAQQSKQKIAETEAQQAAMLGRQKELARQAFEFKSQQMSQALQNKLIELKAKGEASPQKMNLEQRLAGILEKQSQLRRSNMDPEVKAQEMALLEREATQAMMDAQALIDRRGVASLAARPDLSSLQAGRLQERGMPPATPSATIAPQQAVDRAMPGPAVVPPAGGLAPQPAATPQLPLKNARGWTLMTDKNGNKAYVSPTGEVEEVK